MSTFAKATIAALVLGAFVFFFRRWQARHSARKRVFGPRSRRPDDSYQATNAVAKLLQDVLDLRGRQATWPAILQTLNPDNTPALRTILLELRWLHVNEPSRALQLIERVCINAKRPGEEPTRLEILEIAKSLSEKVKEAA